MRYRYELDGHKADSYEPDVDVVTALEVNQVLDIIEGMVNDALKQIEHISGIEDIDNCKKILSELSDNLY